MASRRLPFGGEIDRAASLSFRFNGTSHQGFAGDTLASALLAGGIDVVASSPIHGRPRGVMTAGVEEPCAFVEVTAPTVDVVTPATTVVLEHGLVAAGRSGVGRLPPNGGPRPPRCEPRHVHADTLVIGGGIAGLEAAVEALMAGDDVVLVDERSRLQGNAFWRAQEDAAAERIAAWAARLEETPGALVLRRATALGLYDDGYVVVHERSLPIERLWHVRARRVVLATGLHERPIPFRDNDRPGVMLASAVVEYLEQFAVLCGERAVVFTTTDSAYTAARALRDAGAMVEAIVDVRSDSPAQRNGRADGFNVLSGWTIAGTEGNPSISSVHVTDGVRRHTIDADLVAVSGGWNPVLQLYRAIGGRLRYDETRASFVPAGGAPPWLEVRGAATGEIPPSAPYWFVPDEDLSRHYVDMQRDATIADLVEALGAGLRSAEHVKRYTYIGTAVDQGRTSSVATAEAVNQLLGWDPGAQGPTNARPPYSPVSFSALAGFARGSLFDPARVTPIHQWHRDHGAVFENVGQWKRPWYYPQPNEGLHAAVERECLAVRTRVGVMDATTLGKVEVVGPDAATFLDLMYTNVMSSLRVGSIRYGVLLGLDGMVMDDGVVMRLAEDRFMLTTTTGGAAKVLDHFEEWLQTEWPQMRVYCMSVTEQWATVAVVGPRAREVIASLGTEVDLSVEAFPWMTVRHGTVAGVPARIARVSFSGELAYELNVAGWHGLSLWEAVMEAGRPFGITPYGTETMHVLRAEKGYVIVGQDTDGTVTPHDLGMSWIVSAKKRDFIGRRSLRRPDVQRPDRKQLVGLLPNDRDALLPEGAQLIAQDTDTPPAPMMGHITSSYRSAILGRTFALALVTRGRELHGLTLFASAPGRMLPATVTEPVFYDPEGARRDG
jgi:sarcosine oxidase, subunit alpha